MLARKSPRSLRHMKIFGLVAGLSSLAFAESSQSQPSMVTPELSVRTAVSSLTTPIGMVFLGPNDFLIIEKNTGQVRRITNGLPTSRALDLGVNFFNERGLLGIALHPDFPQTPQVFLFWTTRSSTPPTNRNFPHERIGLDSNMFLPDTDDTLSVPLLGNRVDRFIWDGSSLTFDRNLIHLRAFQNDAAAAPPGQGDQAQPARGNHNGGVIAFGPDGKLYVFFGDQGRRGQLQNLPSGPTETGLGPTMPDDQFGGPEPDDAHFAGVVLRLETDGTAPADNPFFALGAQIGGEAGGNIQKIFAYGFRNGFGMAFDPETGLLWEADNGEDAYDEVNRVDAGMNSGWIQVQGPIRRVSDFREIETTSLHHEDSPNLQQLRWPSENIATTHSDARKRLYMLPGAVYRDPEISFKYVVAPAAIGFGGSGLGPAYDGKLFMGLSTEDTDAGALLYMGFNAERNQIRVDDDRLKDGVVDNLTFHETTEVESLLIGRNFGVVTDIKTGPTGNLYVVSISRGSVFEIFRTPEATNTASQATRSETSASGLRASSPIVSGIASSIRYALPERSEIDLAIFDLQGRRVATLVSAVAEAGSRVDTWNGTNQSGSPVTPGAYFVRLGARGLSGKLIQQSSRVIVLR